MFEIRPRKFKSTADVFTQVYWSGSYFEVVINMEFTGAVEPQAHEHMCQSKTANIKALLSRNQVKTRLATAVKGLMYETATIYITTISQNCHDNITTISRYVS